MRLRIRWLGIVCAIVAAAIGGYWYGHGNARQGGSAQHASVAASAAQSGPVVPVRTVPIRLSTITETITAYGRVVAQPGETRVLSLPFESRVERMLVTAGQQVQVGAPLVEIAPSPAARLQLQQARDALTTAQKVLQQTQEKYNQHFATKTQLVQAQQAARSAQLKLNKLENEGVGQTTDVKAQFSGIVSKVATQEGQLVAAGSPLVEIAVGDRIEARLGVEPEDIPYVRDGDPVDLTPVNLDPRKPVIGHVRLVTQQVNPKTQLIEVLVSLPPHAGLTLFAYVRGTMIAASQKALIVPAEAVLPEKNGYALFTVTNGHAVKHVVHLGLETDKEVEILGDSLKPGQPVVLAGNYELRDGMAVSRQTHP